MGPTVQNLLRHQLTDSGARAIVILANFAHTLAEVLDEVPIEHTIVTQVGDLFGFPKSSIVNFVVRHIKKMVPPYEISGEIRFSRFLASGARSTFQRHEPAPEDIAFLQYTGGTTGVSKGAMLTHRNLVANLEQASTWLESAFEPENSDVIITALPLYHIFALTCNCLSFMKTGGHNVLVTNPRDMPGFVAELQSVRFNALTGVNTLFNGLLNTPGFDQIDFSSLKVSLGGGMAVQRAVAEKWEKVTGTPLVEGYGLTETSPIACVNPLDIDGYTGTIGLPVPSTELSIRDEDGVEVPTGEAGEIWIRGPQVMKGYWQRPEETAKVLTENGWLKTGDIATVDEKGYFKIVDRKKDMIIVSGFNVYPNEIEEVLVTHPGVLEAAAIGVADAESGERVKACIVRKDPAISESDILSHCRENLTGYKVPKIIQFYDELPKSNVGKILRRELREA